MAEKKVIELDVDTNLGSLKSQLKQAQAEVQTLSDKFGATSREAVAAAKSAAILKDKIADAKALTDAFNPDAKFKALSGSLTGVAGGFSVVTGAMGAFGKQSEEVESALLKVQSAMALASGAQALGESIDSFKQLGAVLKANSIVQKVVNVVTLAYNAIMAANPVMAIVAGIAALVAIGYKLITMFQESAAVNDKAAAATKRNTNALNEQIKANDRASESLKTKNAHDINMAKASGASAEAIRKLALKHADEEIALEKASLATAKNTYEKEKNTLASYKNAGVSDELITKQRELVVESRKNLQEEYKDLSDAYKNKQAVARANQVEVKQEQTDLKKSRIDAAKEANEKIADNQKTADDTLKQQKKDNNAVIAKADADAALLEIQRKNALIQLEQDIAEQNYLNTLTDKEKEELALQDKYFNLETLAEGNKEALAEIELAKMNELNDINLKYQDIEKEARDKKAKADKDAAKKELEEAKAVAEQKAAIQMQGLDTALQGVQLIKGLFEKQKGVQKAAVIAESAIGIAKMIIANKLANVAALATPQAIASSGVAAAPVIAMNNISTGIGIAANIAATAKALKTLGGGTPPTDPSGGGGGTGGAGGVMSANFNVVGNSGLNQLGQLQQKPMKAYVVSGDMTTAQSLDRNRIENATLVQ
jgi:hypothetical protein